MAGVTAGVQANKFKVFEPNFVTIIKQIPRMKVRGICVLIKSRL